MTTQIFDKISRTNCPCCNGTEFNRVHHGYDDRLGYPDIFNVVQCNRCSYVFIQDPVKIELIPELYHKYYPEFPNKMDTLDIFSKAMSKIGSQQWFRFLEGDPELSILVKHGETVLDVGCSYGATSAIVMARNASWTGIEVDPKCCKYLEEKGLDYYRGTIEEFAEVSEKKYSTIMFSQVFEHLYDPIGVLNAAKKLLAENGRVLISVPNYLSRYRKKYGRSWLHWHIPYHVTQWCRKSFEQACCRSGLSIHRFSTHTFFAWWRLQRMIKSAVRGQVNSSYLGKPLPKWIKKSGLAVLYHLFVDVYLRVRDKYGDGDLILVELRIDRENTE